MEHKKTGYRSHTPGLARAVADAQQFQGTDLKPGEALALAKAAITAKGLPHQLRSVIDLLFKYTSAADWKPGNHPIVWPSNATLAEELGLGVRTIQKYTKQAINEGFIAPMERPSRRRHGYRTAHGLTKDNASGFSLAPIAVRETDLRQAVKLYEEERRTHARARIRLETARKKIAALIAAGRTFAPDHSWDNTATKIKAYINDAKISPTKPLAERRIHIEKYVQLLETFAQRLDYRIDEIFNLNRIAIDKDEGQNISLEKEDSREGESQFTHITTTTQLPFSKFCKGFANKGSSGLSRPGALASINENDQNIDLYKITPQMAEKLLAQRHLTAPDDELGWDMLNEEVSMEFSKRRLGHKLWYRLMNHAGPRAGTIAVLIAMRKFDDGKVSDLGAYIQGMASAAERQELNVGRSVYGLLS